MLTVAGDNPNTPIFPQLYDRKSEGDHGLPTQFRRIMEQAGTDPGRIEGKGGKGRSTSLLSFQSLRHSFTSVLANAAVSLELRQKLTGHSSTQMHQLYAHTELEKAVKVITLVGI